MKDQRREIKFKRILGTLKDILIDKDMIIKNRLGPYRILLKIEEDNMFYGISAGKLVANIRNCDYAYDFNSILTNGLWAYYKRIQKAGKTPSIWLTTQTGLIELLISDFRQEFRDKE